MIRTSVFFWISSLLLLGCQAETRPVAGDSIIQVVGGDCRHEALGCQTGFACTAVAKDTWACLPTGAEPDAGSPAGDMAEPDAFVPDKDPGGETPGELKVTLELPVGVMSGLATITAVVTGSSVLGVEFQVDGQPVGTDVIPPFTALVNTTLFQDGPHTLRAETADQHGQTAEVSLEAVFDNTPPQIVNAAPPEGAAIFFEDGPLTMSLEVEDPSLLEQVTFRANGLLVAELAAAPYHATIGHSELFITEQSLPKAVYVQFQATDSLGQMTEVAHNIDVFRRRLFTFETLGEIWGGAALLNDGNIVFGNHQQRIFAVTQAGEKAWEYATSDDVTAAPVVDPNTGRIYFGALDGRVTALDGNGSKVWSQETGSPTTGQPVIDGDSLVVVTFEGTVYEMALSNGSVSSSPKLPGFVSGGPAVGPMGTRYVGCQDHHLYALKGGAALWSVETGGEVWSTPAVDTQGAVYFGSNDGWVYAVSALGDVKWQVEVEGQIWGRLVTTEEPVLYVASTSKFLHKLNTLDGSTLWKTKLAGITTSAPTLDSDGTVYVGTTTGILYGVDGETGDIVFSYDLEKTMHATPLVVGDSIFVGTLDRNLHGLWRYGATPNMP